MSMQDRPARPGRTKPVPAADAGVDPVDFRPSSPPPETPAAPAAAVPAPAPSAKTPPPTDPAPSVGPQATVQLGVNVHPDVAQLVAQIKANTGLSKRAIVEKAILDTWRKS